MAGEKLAVVEACCAGVDSSSFAAACYGERMVGSGLQLFAVVCNGWPRVMRAILEEVGDGLGTLKNHRQPSSTAKT